jgi:hypothetical protein
LYSSFILFNTIQGLKLHLDTSLAAPVLIDKRLDTRFSVISGSRIAGKG